MEEDNLINLICSSDKANRVVALSIAHGAPEEYPRFWGFMLRIWCKAKGVKNIAIPKNLDKALEYDKCVFDKVHVSIYDEDLDIQRFDAFYNATHFSFATEKVVTMPTVKLFSNILIKYQKELNEDSLSNIYFSDYPSSGFGANLGLVGSNICKSETITNIIQKWCDLTNKPELTIYIGLTPLVNNIRELCNLKDFIVSKPDTKKRIGIYNSLSRNLLDLPILDFAS